jgi:tungstate transport system ATP-binding protein
VILCLRPENVILSEIVAGSPAGTRNTFPANVVRITPMGPYQKVQLNCGFSLVAYVPNPSFSELSLKKGTEVLASFKAKTVHAIVGASRSVLTEAKSGGSSRQETVG